MGKYYENLVDLTELVKKLDKKSEVAVFIIRCLSYAKENPQLSIHQIIKDTKKNRM